LGARRGCGATSEVADDNQHGEDDSKDNGADSPGPHDNLQPIVQVAATEENITGDQEIRSEEVIQLFRSSNVTS
jgi:hypothetical protein